MIDWCVEMTLGKSDSLSVGDIFSCHAVDNPDLQSEMVNLHTLTVKQFLLQHDHFVKILMKGSELEWANSLIVSIG